MKIYCSGIGGIGLSAYAALQNANGHTVMGSDRNDSALLQDLRSQGIEVFLNQDGSCVPDDIDLMVYTEAVPPDAPERKKADALGVRSVSYFHALGDLSKDFYVISICGTHGKSSTTAMTARLFIEAGKDPTVIVGTKVPELGGRNWRKGKSNLFIVESCEYRRSFHYLHPSIIAVTNVDGDHFDAYKDLKDYQEAFVEFFKRLPEGGKVIGHLTDPETKRVIAESGKEAVDADRFAPVALSVPGDHMRQNARLALALGAEQGIGEAEGREKLKGFSGTWRRMELKGKGKNGFAVVDDYGHHPVEVKASLAAIRQGYPGKRLICAFQPHTHDRTRKLYQEFLESFADADVILVPNIYGARPQVGEEPVDVVKFVEDLARVSGKECVYTEDLQKTEQRINEMATADDVVVCMGAGDITSVATKLVA